ncbi:MULTISPECIES: flagellar hook-basal body complex protein FliE [Halanaerobium]|jgi:flagellar hook-basal body complex protein FliE|uniref:Flagellar hook-basal body complex protein FliE n=1 Tax=Halanaerobium kushneri TaxID=56779 RepID=A0A1N6UDR6_9FIRM|nr:MULTISPECIES: flagellar hook-basal body complex protein FliE [Halanaerobium]RCW53358.1 flagellar hook-basal body complex protein FliE [Halanaerobium sp. ST460_2HS_T2]SIQ63739.1 flagellar hook-basal body complex protein FliE [Halanaerobium kushneri]
MEINPVKFQSGFENFSLENENKNKKTEAFSDLFREKMNEVNQLQKDSQAMTASFAAGETDNIHDVMIAAEKAKVAVNLTTAVQTKVIDAYNEIMRLQV